jgi:hypothetical protein
VGAALFLCFILEESSFTETEEFVNFVDLGDSGDGDVGGFESLEKSINKPIGFKNRGTT